MHFKCIVDGGATHLKGLCVTFQKLHHKVVKELGPHKHRIALVWLLIWGGWADVDSIGKL